jgi:hypothetical protein
MVTWSRIDSTTEATKGGCSAHQQQDLSGAVQHRLPALKTVDHVATTAGVGRSAWFKDPDGNTLALFQPE